MVLPLVAAGAAGLSAIAGAGAARRAEDDRHNREKMWMRTYDYLLPRQTELYNRAEASIQDKLRTIREGYGAARDELARGGSASRQEARDQGAQTTAGVNQSLRSRGLGNTTAYQNAVRGISADTSRVLAGIDENLARLGANLRVGETEATGAAQSELSQFQIGRSNAEERLRLSRMNDYAATKGSGAGGSPFDFSGLADLVSGFFDGPNLGRPPGMAGPLLPNGNFFSGG